MGLVLISPEEIIIEKSLKFGFSATNIVAEYETLLMGMSMVQKMGGKGSRIILGFKIGSQPSERKTGSPRSKNTGVFESS